MSAQGIWISRRPAESLAGAGRVGVAEPGAPVGGALRRHYIRLAVMRSFAGPHTQPRGAGRARRCFRGASRSQPRRA